MVSPLILVPTSIMLVFLLVAYTPALEQSADNTTNGDCEMFLHATHQLFCGLYTMEICLVGIFLSVRNQNGRASCSLQAILAILLLPLTCVIQVTICCQQRRQIRAHRGLLDTRKELPTWQTSENFFPLHKAFNWEIDELWQKSDPQDRFEQSGFKDSDPMGGPNQPQSNHRKSRENDTHLSSGVSVLKRYIRDMLSVGDDSTVHQVLNHFMQMEAEHSNTEQYVVFDGNTQASMWNEELEKTMKNTSALLVYYASHDSIVPTILRLDDIRMSTRSSILIR